jgi:hypothetical protein
MSYSHVSSLSDIEETPNRQDIDLQSIRSNTTLRTQPPLANEAEALRNTQYINNRDSSPEPTQQGKGETIPKKFKPAHSKFNFSTSWLLEILSWLLALCLFAAIVGILFAFDGNAKPQWKFGITLGALVSIFATLGASVLMLPVESAMGQLKWMWFLQQRPVADFETLSKASHGPGGSFLLLLKRKGGSASPLQFVQSPIDFVITDSLLLLARY